MQDIGRQSRYRLEHRKWSKLNIPWFGQINQPTAQCTLLLYSLHDFQPCDTFYGSGNYFNGNCLCQKISSFSRFSFDSPTLIRKLSNRQKNLTIELNLSCLLSNKQSASQILELFSQPCKYTLLGSGSESPKDEALLLTTVSYFKKEMKKNIEKENQRAVFEGWTDRAHGQSSQSADF